MLKHTSHQTEYYVSTKLYSYTGTFPCRCASENRLILTTTVLGLNGMNEIFYAHTYNGGIIPMV